MIGRRAALDDSTVCSNERTLFSTYFVYIFSFIEGNAVSVMNLNYSICMKNLNEKLSKMVVKSAATSNSTHTTKVIQK